MTYRFSPDAWYDDKFAESESEGRHDKSGSRELSLATAVVEPSAFTRSTWVDNSTTPVSVWYADYQLGTLVRIQPRD